MKKIILAITTLLFITSCSDNLERYNVDPKNPIDVDPAFMLSYAQYNLAKQMGDVDYNANVSRLWANYATQTTYIQESSYDAANRDIGGTIWDNIYTENLLELSKAKATIATQEVTAAELPAKNNKLAVITILETYAYQYLVDNFGDVPFTEALDINNVTPKYDDDQFIYTAITANLEDAISKITTGADSFGSADLIYGGDMTKWSKFANTLLLKIGTRLSDVNPSEASRLINAAVSGGVFTSNADNPKFIYTGVQPYINPVYDYFVVDSRNSDFVATENFIALLDGMSDPRIDVYYDDNIAGGMVGGVYGAAGNAYDLLTHFNPAWTDNNVEPTTLLEYSTVCFELAEAVERGFISGIAANYYNAGVTASFNELGIGGDAAAYLILNPYNAANWEQSIGIQKYISLFHNAHEAWTEARRTGIPQLATAASNGVANPKRMIYPVEEVLINTTNYNAASTNIGGDATTSAIFWDVD
ncbi:SusD/RagB family nutrient-binding outer membrane lipoprotein [Tenacibaculum caenipelagi]|uniref:SusD-like starch-binding protein associating with outer membrane n=1 Tax=Tenacibaculum caenipelagi TaxID=1325435 RepID=A0A4R6TKK6_9FLAO|nr:SusD/RagB family nutrient-binding outer membrane lipoprotein [Tenacibaculum caenipelagi]TDQ30047.1 SusD-like starch-binding protein associating with outer membrane [Tenacibaculum caenipelagi]